MRDVSSRAGHCAAAGLLTFVAICTLPTGNVFAVAVDLALMLVTFGMAVALARQGRI